MRVTLPSVCSGRLCLFLRACTGGKVLHRQDVGHGRLCVCVYVCAYVRAPGIELPGATYPDASSVTNYPANEPYALARSLAQRAI